MKFSAIAASTVMLILGVSRASAAVCQCDTQIGTATCCPFTGEGSISASNECDLGNMLTVLEFSACCAGYTDGKSDQTVGAPCDVVETGMFSFAQFQIWSSICRISAGRLCSSSKTLCWIPGPA
ncbi:hypothetical protein BX666DRAFT_2126080 [Dichotomocladium elegans]|nr:hypothetical protein BX666DRAFT_2126080 [Dichotomocladium elegans]